MRFIFSFISPPAVVLRGRSRSTPILLLGGCVEGHMTDEGKVEVSN